MIDPTIITLFGSNLVGVAFGLLMYQMATKSIKENTDQLKELTISIKELCFHNNYKK